MFLFKFFFKGKSAKQKNFYKINPDEFILISKHLALITNYLDHYGFWNSINSSNKKSKYQNSLQFQI